MPEACADNTYRCEGLVLKRCNVNRTGFDPAETCQPTARCDEAVGKCIAGTGGGDGGDKTCVFDDENSKFDDCTFGP